MEIEESKGMNEICEIEIGNEKIILKFPSQIKQQMEIESNKGLLSKGQYAILSLNNVASSNRVLDTIDMISHFAVIIPEFSKKVGLKEGQNYMDMDFRMARSLTDQYNKIYAPFYNQFVTEEEMIGTPMVVMESKRRNLELEKKIEESKKQQAQQAQQPQ